MKYLIAKKADKEYAVIFADDMDHKDLMMKGPIEFHRAGHLVISLKSQTASDGRVLTGMNFICIPGSDCSLPGDKLKDEALIQAMIGENI